MEETFGDALELSIYRNDSEEAKNYNLKASTTVFINGDFVPLDIAVSERRMEEFLKSGSKSSKQDYKAGTENKETELKKRIAEDIRKKYSKVSVTPEGLFGYPTGKEGLEGLDYDPEILRAFPEDVLVSYCGVGNIFTLGPIEKDEIVLDIGCGGGVDTLIAAMMVGPSGKVVGLDMVAEILGRAEQNLEKTELKNVTFKQGSAEDLSLPDQSFDVIISNGVFNLILDKSKAVSEAFRVLKPQGRFMIADQILVAPLEESEKAEADSWSQ